MFVMASTQSNLNTDDETLELCTSFFNHVNARYGQPHPHAIAALPAVGLMLCFGLMLCLRDDSNLNMYKWAAAA